MNIAALLYFLNVIRATPAFVYSRATRSYGISRFEVHSLPDSPALPASWAGRLPVPGRADGNDIFFWLFQAEQAVYNDNLISMSNWKTHKIRLLTIYSLVQWRPWLFIFNRAYDRQWPHLV